MKRIISDGKIKEFFTQFSEILEDICLANATAHGRKNDFVSEDEMFDLLKGKYKHHGTQT